MKFSYNWLNEYFDEKLPEANEVATKVGLHSFELEGTESLDGGDVLIDWDVLPNRSSDCLCYDGIVKEISSVLDIEAKNVLHRVEDVSFDESFKTSDFVSLEIGDESLIPRASKRLAIDVKIEDSPEWLKERLESMGQRSINNVVDITNYVMLVTGQPVHAFDYDKLKGADSDGVRIEIKKAIGDEEITDLAGDVHKLDDTMLVITDGDIPMDIAGVKGGNDTGVDENTKRVLMSACNFNFQNIRNTSRKLKIQTDASKRFENEVPLVKIDMAMKQFGYLMQELAGAKVSEEIVDTNSIIPEGPAIKVDSNKLNSLLGLELSSDEISKILERLQFEHTEEGGIFEVKSPNYRTDLNISQDIIEEVGRIYGYSEMEPLAPEEGFNSPSEDPVRSSRYKVTDVLVNLGFYEVFNRTFTDSGEVEIQNPLTSESGFTRTNLLEANLKRAEKNLQHSDEPRIFEIGKVFTGIEGDSVLENYSFAGVIGKRKIKEKQKADVFYIVKGILESVFDNLSVSVDWKEAGKDESEDIVSSLEVNGEKIGEVGVNFWEINFEKLVSGISKEVKYSKASKYPKIERDVAFFVSENDTVKESEDLILETLPEQATGIKLFDIYEDKENNKKSFGFRITFQSHEETLSDDFANEAMDRVYKTLESKGFEIR